MLQLVSVRARLLFLIAVSLIAFLVFRAQASLAQTAIVTPSWVQQYPATVPTGRDNAAMVYDAATGNIVLFGGFLQQGASGVLGDTWIWDGANWKQQFPANSPSARYGASMAYDAATGNVVLFGGANPNTGSLNDTWTWNGVTWTQQSPANSPSGRYSANVAYDNATGTVVLFGGTASGYMNDTWTWNGSTWTQQLPANSPPARYGSAMAYDASSGNVLLFGGVGYVNGTNAYSNDTWAWNGSAWTQQQPASSPSARDGAIMTYDFRTSKLLLLGGSNSSGAVLSDTWGFEGGTWTQQPSQSSPGTMYLSVMAYDPADQGIVFFGGNSLNEAWTYANNGYIGPTTPVGSAAAQTPVYFTITTAGVLPGLSNGNVLTQGLSGLDFTLGTGSSCTGAVTVGQTCAINVAFTPRTPGQRIGAVNLFDFNNNLLATAYISGTGTGPLVTFTPGTITTIAGNGTQCITSSTTGCGDNGSASSAQLYDPAGVAVDGVGNVYIADEFDERVRKFTASTGVITTVAGNGTQCTTSASIGCGDNGPATSAQLFNPSSVALDGAGNLYIADPGNHRIRMVNAVTGVITTVAGSGVPCTTSATAGCADDGAATLAQLNSPAGVAVDGAGNLYIADTLDQRVREVAGASGIIATVAGNGTQCTTSSNSTGCGDNAPATSAQLNLPTGVAVDGAGNLYIADRTDQRIRKVTPISEAIATVAGNGSSCSTAGCGDNSAATYAQLYNPFGIAVDAAGDLYVADEYDHQIRYVAAGAGIITAQVGSGTRCATSATTGCADSGAATLAQLNDPTALALDGAGNLYIADYANNRIRKVSASSNPLAFPVSAVNASSPAQTLTVNNIGNAVLTLPIPSTGMNPSLSANFTLSNSSTCHNVTSSSSSPSSISPGSCTEVLNYAPSAAGSVTADLVFTDNNLNVVNSTQTSVMTGSTTSSLTISVIGQNIASTATPITLEFIVGFGGNPPPTGTPTLTVNGSAANVGPVTCTAKAGHNNCTAAYNPSSLSPGAYTITATQAADSSYTTATSGTGTLTITGPAGSHIASPVRGTLNPVAVTPVSSSEALHVVQPVITRQAAPTAFVPALAAPVVNLATSPDDSEDDPTTTAKKQLNTPTSQKQ